VTGNPLDHAFGMPVYLVKPKEPTVLGHKKYHEISSTNLLLGLTVRPLPPDDMPEATLTPSLVEQFSTIHIVPEILDVERFNTALAEALSSFPLPAGRLVRPGTPNTPWAVRSGFIPSLPSNL